VEIDSGLHRFIEQRIHSALEGWDRRIGHVHVRLYKQIEETGLYTCHIRVDKLLSGGMALGAWRGSQARDCASTLEFEDSVAKHQ
jgi:hypothetical protein